MDPRPTASPELEAKLREFWQLDNDVATLTEQLSLLKARRKDVGENELSTMARDEEVRHSGVRLSDGTEVRFELDVSCGILKADRERAYAWLAVHNADGMLKRHLVISFPKDSAHRAEQVKQLIARILPEYEIGLKIGKAPLVLVDAVRELLTAANMLPSVTLTEELELPGATLAAFVKKSIASGVNLPEMFGVYAPLKPILVPPPAPSDDVAQETKLMAQLKGSIQHDIAKAPRDATDDFETPTPVRRKKA